jgi:hypothetical protein
VAEQDAEHETDTKELEGQYANHYRVGHNAFEFVLDFGQSYEEYGKARFHTRIITSPAYAKELLATLGEAIETYEQNYGTICDTD